MQIEINSAVDHAKMLVKWKIAFASPLDLQSNPHRYSSTLEKQPIRTKIGV